MEPSNYWTRRLERRRFLAGTGVAAAGAAGIALVGCNDDDDDNGGGGGGVPTAQQPGQGVSPTPSTPTSQSAIDKSTKEGIVKVRHQQVYASINPWKGLDSGLTWCWYVFDHLFYTPLDTLKPEMQLATGLEQPDPTRFIFKMKPSTFHNKAPINGRSVVANDVKASMETARKQPGVSQTTFWSAIFDSIETPDEKTVVVKLKVPYAWALATDGLSGPINGSIVPAEIAAEPNKMDTDLIGSGRFEFVSHQNGTNFKMKRFDKWREAPEPYLAGIEYRHIQDQAAAIAAFSAKEIDSLGLNNKLEREQLTGRHGKDITIDQELSRSVWTVQPRADGRWADPRARKALNMALDRKEYIELMHLGEGSMSGPVPPSFGAVTLPESELKETYWKFDAAEARKLLAASGFDTNTEIEIKYATLGDNFAKYAQIVSAQVEKNLGVKTKIVGEDLGKWLQQSLYGSDYKDLIIYPTLAYETPTTYIILYAKDIGGRPNWAMFLDDEMDAAVKKAETTLDDTARFNAYKDLQRKGIEKGAPAIVTHVQVANTAVWNYLKGRVTGRGSYGLFNGKLYVDKG